MNTEAEAKEKWCPLVRFKFAATSDNSASNREYGKNPHFHEGTRCIGSACMAWRWHHKAYFSIGWPGGTDGRYIERGGKPFGTTQYGDQRTITAWAPVTQDEIGYCGAFGEPK